MIGVLLLLVIISASTAALTVSGRTEIAISRNHEMATQAQVAAEAGLNHAVDVMLTSLRRWQPNGFASPNDAMTSLLLGPDNLSGTVADDADNGSLEATGIPRPPARLTLAGTLGAQYEARIYDEDDPARGLTLTAADLVRIAENGQLTADGNTQVVVQAIGYASDGSMTTLEALIVPADAPAIVANGTLTVQGNPDIVGTNGSVHANGDLNLGGSATVSENATAAGDYNESGNPTIGGSTSGAQSTQPVPEVNAIDYKPLADYILTGVGTMTNGVGAVICDAWADANACETAGYMWVFAGGNGWTASSVGDPLLTDGFTYYAETDLTMTGNMGTNGDPLNITLIAEGNIDIAGNGVLEANTPGLLFVTDKDLKMVGGKDQVGAEAQILVREQLSLLGNTSLRGQIVIENAASTSDLVTDNRVGGNASLTNDGTLTGTGFAATGWREL